MKRFFEDTIKRHSITIGNRNEVDEILALPIFSQDILGQNILHPNWTWKTTMGKQMIFVFIIIYVILSNVKFFEDKRNLVEASQAGYGLVFMFLLELKMLLFISNREEFKKSYLIAKTVLLEIIKSALLSKELIKKLQMVVYILFACVFLPLLGSLLYVLWHYILDTRVNLTTSCPSFLPMTSPYYEISLIFHIISYFIVVNTCFVVDFWFIIFVVIFCTTSDGLVMILKVGEEELVETEMEYKDRLNVKLRTFYGHHIKLVEFFNMLNSIYKWLAIVPLFNAYTTLCIILFSMTEGMQYHFLFNHAILALFQICAYTWFGEQAIFKGSQLKNALLEFDWTSMRRKDKKNYLIIISYMKKEFRIKTAFNNDLCLVMTMTMTMTSLLKASYQACALLRTMDI